MDLKSAFDFLSRSAVWLLLHSVGIPQKIINLMPALYTDSSSCVWVSGELSNFFTFLTGVRQGCVLAPDSFDISLDWLLDHTVPRSVPCVSVGLDYFSDLDYADDVALLLNSLNYWNWHCSLSPMKHLNLVFRWTWKKLLSSFWMTCKVVFPRLLSGQRLLHMSTSSPTLVP